MKKLFFILLLVSFNSFANISIISDLDDTIKITNSGSEVEGSYNAVFTNKVFTGMTEFFKASRDYSQELHVLSASPLILRHKILTSLAKSGIEINSLTLKNSLRGETKIEYKVKEIKRMLENSSDDFILIGDDVGQDPEAYDEILKLYPERILAIYIHAIKNRQLPPTSFKYWSTFDLSLKEYLAGRMGNSWVKESAQLILSEKKMELIFPLFAKCPNTPDIWLWQVRTLFIKEAFQIAKKLNTHCIARNSGI